MKKVALSLTALLLVVGAAVAGPVIRHAKVSTKPASADPSQIGGPDWNADHVIDTTALLGAEGITIVSSDPNGTAGTIGQLAWDRQDAQLFINTDGGTTWTAFVRSDGGTSPPATFFLLIGDSNAYGHGVAGLADSEWQIATITSEDQNVVFNSMSAPAPNDPIVLTEDVTTGSLRKHPTDGSGFDFGVEISLGRTLEEAIGRVVFVKFVVSGITIDKMKPTSTYTPSGMGGLNVYQFIRDRARSFASITGRTLGGVFSIDGGNDGNDATLAGNVSANLQAIAAQLRADFGNQVAFIQARTHTGIGVPFFSTVIAQQQAAALVIPGFRLVGIDDAQLNADTVHYLSRGYWTLGQRLGFAMLDQRGYRRRAVTTPAPQIVGYGTAAYGAGNVSPVSWPGSKDGDLLLMIAQSEMGSSSTIATPSGWTAVAGGNSSASGFVENYELFSKKVTQSELDANDGHTANVTVTMPGTENAAQIVTVRGASSTPVVDVSAAFNGNNFNQGPVTATGITTTGANRIVIVYTGGFCGASNSMTVTNGGLDTAIAVVKDSTYLTNANDQTISVWSAPKTAAGATGASTISASAFTNIFAVTVALSAP